VTVVVVGDALLDIDVVGSSSRLCPDAPAPVVDVAGETFRAGGAALAAMLAASDGHDVVLVAPLADDLDGHRLRALLEPHVRVLPLRTDGTTPVKRRVRVDGHTLVRLDTGSSGSQDETLPSAVVAAVQSADAVLVSDYGRGAAAHPVLRELLASVLHRIPVVWDPHPRGPAPVPGCRAVTPNTAEAQSMAATLAAPPTTASGTDLRGIAVAASMLVSAWQTGAVVVTMGARGSLLSYADAAPSVVPTRAVSTGDPCGAGDRFASRLTTLLAEGQVTVEAVAGATAAATDFVASGGATGFSPGKAHPQTDSQAADVIARVRAAGGTVVATGGCFDLLHAGHIASLQAARALGDCLIVCLNSDDSVRRIKGPTRPLVPATDRARVLEALSFVDGVVVFDQDSPVEVLERLRPDVWAKGGDYAGAELPEESVLSRWGGQAVVLPYLAGRSTTALVQTMATGSERREEAG
jgi:D-beta-D-heptose 7-phosphate kinase/D-beta-D-heptose 1-phosphate adenosyltransferase